MASSLLANFRTSQSIAFRAERRSTVNTSRTSCPECCRTQSLLQQLTAVHPPPDDGGVVAGSKGTPQRDISAASSAAASTRASPLQSRRGTLDSVELVERYHFAKNPNRSGSHSPSLYEPRRRLSSFGAQKRVFLDLLRKHGSKLSLSRKFSEVSTKTDELNRENRKLQRDRILARNQLGTALSALYAKLLIIMGVTLPVTELVASAAPANFHQPFYLYLYGVSILFCTYLYVARWRRQTHLEFLSQCPEGGRKSSATATVSASTHSGSFYLRIGAIAFGIGSLVYSALDFGQYFELDADDDGCRNFLVALMPAARMLLCVVQMQFIIVSGKDFGLDRHAFASRFGLMHMLATNVCEWLYVLVEEAKHEIVHLDHSLQANRTDHAWSVTAGTTDNAAGSKQQPLTGVHCRSTNIMSTLVQNVAPFLFPCTIEYSLICALTLYELWSALNRTTDPTRKPTPTDRTVTGRPANRLSIDCSSAQRGLFGGIVTLVLTLIVLIMYFVLRKERHLQRAATLEIVVYEIALYSVTLVAVVVAMVRMRDLRVVTQRSVRVGNPAALPIDCHLLLVTQTGIYIYGVFSIIGTYHTHGQLLHWAVLSEVLALAQTSLQTLFVLSTWWRRCKGARQNRTKPGREIVTFLLVANLAAWMVNSLVKSNASFRPLVMGFYGAAAWAIIAHISMPLAIFYRFHSTICLFEIWKNSYKARDALSTALSALYAKIVVILGIALPVTEILSSQIPANVYQGFYLFLYTVSIAFVIFVYASNMRRRAVLTLIKSYHEKTNSSSSTKKRIPHFGSFYLRVGAIAFGIGTMVYSGLEFGQYFELNASPGCSSIFIALTPAARMILSLVQMQFIFLNTSDLDMARHKVFARFGLMHMVATNLCEWLYVLVEETKHEIHHLAHTTHHKGSISTTTVSTDSSEELLDAAVNHTLSRRAAGPEPTEYVECQRTNIMGSLVQNVSPFLFPCTIEYSLICAVILYEMWKKVKTIAEIDRTRRSSIKVQSGAGSKSAHHFSVDCSRAHRGMFGGILLTVLTIICLIMYFVLYDEPGYEYFAIQEVTIAETLMYALTAVAVVVAMLKMRDLKYQRKKNDHHSGSISLDCTLLVLAQTGVYVYGMFSIVGSYFSMRQGVPGAREGLVAELFSLIQTSIQTLFILNAVWRKCRGAQQNRTKPGREIVTFLLVANMAMWFINTLIKGRASFRPSHLDFFGTWAWTVITHVSMPLAIFYRFHSTICLFEVWKSTYKVKITDHH
uniref:Otopetrin n=1 Tax=Anopheles culicifacies TaxID=139723 RepID=A0A182MBX3_9DIPT